MTTEEQVKALEVEVNKLKRRVAEIERANPNRCSSAQDRDLDVVCWRNRLPNSPYCAVHDERMAAYAADKERAARLGRRFGIEVEE